MSDMEGMDIRAPIGGLFSVLGMMLVLYGSFAPRSVGASDASGGVNVNLWWGAVMLVFGVIMLVMSRRAMSRPE